MDRDEEFEETLDRRDKTHADRYIKIYPSCSLYPTAIEQELRTFRIDRRFHRTWGNRRYTIVFSHYGIKLVAAIAMNPEELDDLIDRLIDLRGDRRQ